jgi:AcrR family transcriptional regulator
MATMTGRPYTKRRRAASEEATRQRIVEAAIALHQTVGPAATTVTDIADRAGVGRVTVYRHFPDEPSLAQACSGTYFARHPFPDPEPWRAIADPAERLATALGETYAYHATTEAMMRHALGDAPDHEVMRPYHAHWERAADVLLAGRRARGRRRELLRAGLIAALSFGTWDTLVRRCGLSPDDAAAVAARLADG